MFSWVFEKYKLRQMEPFTYWLLNIVQIDKSVTIDLR